MMSIRGMTLTLALALVAGPAFAQEAPAKPQERSQAKSQDAPSAPSASSAEEREQEALMDAQRRVLEAQEKALEDPAIKKDLEELQTLVESRMVREDKTVKTKMDRLEKLQGELEQMQTSENPDPEKAASLIGEAQQLAMELAEVQNKVLEQEDVKKRLDVFDKKLRAEMKEIDPEVPSALARLERASQETATP